VNTVEQTAISPIGSSFQSFLEDEGIADEVYQIAREAVEAWIESGCEGRTDLRPKSAPKVSHDHA
jgi:hypothetical protein